MKKNFLWILLIILFSIPAVTALFHSGFFQSDDGEWMIVRFSAFHQALRDGQFPVRFLSRLNYGYGYPVANFLYPGFMYLGEIFKLLGFGFVETVKIILGLSMAGSALFAYLWLSKMFSKWTSFVGALAYLYAPYHLFDLYKRGSVGEILALCLVPFILWQIERKSFLWASLGIAFLAISHNSLSLLFIFLIVFYLISRGLAFTVYFLPPIIFGLGLSAFFWIPAIFDLQNTIFSRTQISEWNSYFSSLSLVGIPTLLAFFWYLFKRQSSNSRTASLMFFVGIFFLFLSIPISYFVWRFIPISFIQFPFRFLSVVILSTAFLIAFLLSKIKGTGGYLLGIVFLVIVSVSSFSYISPKAFFDKGESYYATNEGTTTVRNEYMPVWVNDIPTEHYKEKVKIVDGKISGLKVSAGNIDFVASSAINTEITINTVYFPGWKVFVDGKNMKINYIDNGLIKINMPFGTHTIKASFRETPIRLLSDMISLLSFFVLLFVVISMDRKFFFRL